MRRSQHITPLVFVFLALPISIPAQQQTNPVPVRDAQAISILSNALSAMGGQSAGAIQDTLVQATFTPPADQGGSPNTVTIKTKGTGKIREDGSENGKTSSVIYNQGREFRSSDKGWRTASSANAEHKRIEHIPALLLAYELARGDYSATYIGQEPVESRNTHHLRLARLSTTGKGLDDILTKNSQIDIFVDSQTFLITKISYQHLAENDWRRGFPLEIFYNDYRNVRGLLVPFHLKYVYDGQPAGEMQVTSVSVNQGAQDSDFDGRQ